MISNQNVSGKLLVSPKCAVLSRDTEFFAKMSPYVIIKCGNVSKKTLVHEGGGKKPSWNEVYFIYSNHHLFFRL